MAIFPGAISTDSDLYIAVNNLSALLTDNPLTIGATTVNVNSTTLFPTVGFISIDAEIIKYTGKTATSFTGCTRGADGTTAASHTVGTQVDFNVIAAHHNVLKDEVIAVESFISTHLGLTTNVLAAEFEFLDGVSSNLQTQLNAKAPLASPTFTGTVTIPTPFTLGAVSVVTTGTELNFVAGVTSAIQTQLNAKATDSLVVHLAGSEVITGAKTFQDQKLLLQETGGSDVITINVAALAASRAYTLPDAGGAASFVMTESAQTINGAKTFGSPLLSSLGSASLPGYSFVGDPNTGMYSTGADSLNWTTNGVERMALGTTQLFTNLQFVGKGTTTNDNAAAGFLGEHIRSSVAAAVNAAASGSFTNITSISLSAGDWDITGLVIFTLNGATLTGGTSGYVSAFSGTDQTDRIDGDNSLATRFPTGSENTSVSVANWRVSINSTTTYYLKFNYNYSGGTPQAYGRISARRVR